MGSPSSSDSTATVVAKSGASVEEQLFRQHRIAFFGWLGFIISVLFFAFRYVMGIVKITPDPRVLLAQPAMRPHLAGTIALGVIWLICRGPQRPERLVSAVELVGIFIVAVCYAWIAAEAPLDMRPELFVLLIMNYCMISRAMFVPSTPRRTFVVTAVTGIPIVVICAASYAGQPTMHNIYRICSMPLAIASELSSWWLMTVIMATFASKIIYGLRQKIRQARRIGQYVLEEKLGEGGMGIVYRARHAMLRRPTALKLLPPEKAGDQAIHRFEREVRLTATLTHPNTVTVYDYGRTPEGVFYYAMELLEGATLEEVVAADGPQPAGRVVHVLEQVAGALIEAHAIGLIHRDIKPANIILGERGGLADMAKVMDFGLVKEIRAGADLSLSGGRLITGTPHYMSPEAITTPDKVDARSDLYSIGCVGYFLLTGRRVFEGDNVIEVCAQHLQSHPAPPSKWVGSRSPEPLEKLLLACLEKDPARRPQSSVAFRQELLGLDVIDSWTSMDAHQWWQIHGAALGELRSAVGQSEANVTMAIDLDDRSE